MSPRPKHRGYRSPGLFGFQAGGEVTDEPDVVPDNPKHRPCPACGARAGEACSRPSKQGGRQPLRAVLGDPLRRGFHPARAVIPDPSPDTADTQDPVPAAQPGRGRPEPVPAEAEQDPHPLPVRQRPSQPPQPPPSARAKADLRWAMNL